MKNYNKLIDTIKSRLSNVASNPVGREYKGNDLLAVFSTDYTFVIAYTEVESPIYSSWKFNLRGIYGNSLIDRAVDPINPDYMKASLRWYKGFTTSDVTTKTYLAIDITELVPSNFLHRGMIYDGDLLKLHHEVMHVLSMQPEIIDFIGASILGIKKNDLFSGIYDTIGGIPAISKWPQVSSGNFGFTSMRNYSPYANELDTSSILGLFHKNGRFEFVVTEYGQTKDYRASAGYRERCFWYLRNALTQRIIARTREENARTPKQIPIWCREEKDDNLGMAIAASKIIPPQAIRCSRFISVDNLKRIENSINCLLEDRPELLEPFFPKPVQHNIFDVLRMQSAKYGQESESYSKEVEFYYQKLREAETSGDEAAIDYWNTRIKEAQKRKKYTMTQKK